MPAVLTLLAALGVTVLGTDLPVLIPSYGLREVGSFIAKPLYISHSGCSHPLLYQWHVNACGQQSHTATAEHPSPLLPAPKLPSWLSPAAKLSSKR